MASSITECKATLQVILGRWCLLSTFQCVDAKSHFIENNDKYRFMQIKQISCQAASHWFSFVSHSCANTTFFSSLQIDFWKVTEFFLSLKSGWIAFPEYLWSSLLHFRQTFYSCLQRMVCKMMPSLSDLCHSVSTVATNQIFALKDAWIFLLCLIMLYPSDKWTI